LKTETFNFQIKGTDLATQAFSIPCLQVLIDQNHCLLFLVKMSKSTDFPTHRSQLSAAKQALLEKRLRGELPKNQRAQTIPQRLEQSIAPLSFAQQRLWFLNQLEPGSAAYNLPRSIRLTGQLNIAALKQSFNEIVRRHESLRTTFATVDRQPIQLVAPALTLALPVINLRELAESEREQKIRQLATEEAQRPFSLDKGPLLRVALLQLNQVEHVILLTMHHIVSDAWSTGVLVQEMAALYEAFVSGKPSPLPELPVQYADFASWQRQWLQGEVLESQLAYWKQQLSNAPVLQMPTDRPRLAVQTSRGAQQSLILTKELTKALKTLSQQEGVTLFMTLLAVFKALLYRYTGQKDILVGSPIANRNRAEIEGLIGFFVNTLVLRSDLSGNPSFRELLERVREVTLGAYAHQDLPFELLVEALQPERNLGRNPLFQVMFALNNVSVPTLKLSGLTLNSLKVETGTMQLDLSLDMVETEQGLSASVEYSTDLFEAATIACILEHFQILLEGIVANPNQRLSDLPLLTQGERQKLLVEWNNTQIDDQQNQCIHELFEAQVARSPDAVAVASEDEQLTYQELNIRANQLAHYLQSLGVGPEVPVGICVERSLEMVVGLLAILKAGGAYVPLDPTYPQERLAFMLNDAQVTVLLTQARLTKALPQHKASVVCLDVDWQANWPENQENPTWLHSTSEATAENLAYVIYTSGSTGNPKGVMVQHSSLVRYIETVSVEFGIQPGDRVLQFASLSFDVAAEEIFSCLVQGATLVLRTDSMVSSVAEFLQKCQDFGLTVLDLPTAFWHQLTTELAKGLALPKPLRLVIIGGERALPERLATWQEHGDERVQLMNVYGPTEATIGATLCEPSRLMGINTRLSEVPIGHAIQNIQTYVLDPHLQLLPIGVPGELYIGGVGLARGYLNRPELTAERFIPHPFSSNLGARLYKTGDLARYLPSGAIEFCGRVDHQLKLRGYRIELGEIEAVLNQHVNVREAVVTPWEDELGNKRLVAHVSPYPEQTLIVTELRRFVQDKLPEYMIPSAFIVRQTLPLTPSGKIDRRALPPPETSRPELEAAYVVPQTELEQAIAKIWQRVLNVEQIGIHDNFFELGGHSLLLVQVHGQLHERFKSDLSMLDLFRYPTISSLAAYFSQASHLASSGEVDQPTERFKDGKARRQQRLQKMQSTGGDKGVDVS
jgi:amino acid adenylation domain-containing protein